MLSDIIQLKNDLIKIFLQQENDSYSYGQVYTVAHGWVLFERLIYKNAVKKQNMRIYLATCLEISVKLIEHYGDAKNKQMLQ